MTAETPDRVRYWRERKGLSQEALGDLCGWPQYKVSRIETGATTVSTEDVELLVDKLGLTMAEFYSGRIKLEERAS